MPIRKQILNDLESIKSFHENIKTLLKDNQFTQDNQNGLFFFNEADLNDTFKVYYDKLEWLTERTFRLWRDNFRAGKYSEVDLDQHFHLGDPILKTEF